MKHLQDETVHTLAQLRHFLTLVSDKDYKSEIPILHHNSIGKHIRHIIEFYDSLLLCSGDSLNYDLRNRSLLLENKRTAALDRMDELCKLINSLTNDRVVYIEGDYGESEASITLSPSSISRELAYNLEHSVHHMAIIRIGVESFIPSVELPEQFGIARSTWRNLQKARTAQKVS